MDIAIQNLNIFNRRVLRFLIPLMAMAILTSCAEEKKNEDTLRIAIASNLQYAVDSLVTKFEREHNIRCEVIPGSSGKLFAQIREGAPYDLFLSADITYPESLYEAGKALEKPEVFAFGSLVLWTTKNDLSPSLGILESDAVRHIAMANPRIAPFGRAAEEALQFYDLKDRLREKLVLGESVAQVNQFIQSGSADLGFTSKAIVLSPGLRDTGSWVQVDPLSHSPLPHGVVQIKSGQPVKSAAREFYDYLFSEEGKSVLKNFGYSVNE